MRRRIIFAATFAGGLFFMVTFFFGGLAPEAFKKADISVGKVLQVVGAFAIGMSLVSIGSVHGKRLIHKRKGWPYSLTLFAGIATAAVVGLVSHYAGEKTFWWDLNYELIYNGLISPLGSSMFALLAFYMVSAAFRAFRIRSTEAALMMAAALVVMVAQMPPMQMAVPECVSVKQWLLEVVNMGAQRAILIGSGLAGLVVALRIWLGIERGAFFDQH